MVCKNCGREMLSDGYDDGGCNDAGSIAELYFCPVCGHEDCLDAPQGSFEEYQSGIFRMQEREKKQEK